MKLFPVSRTRVSRGAFTSGVAVAASALTAWAFLGPEVQISTTSPFGPLADCGNFPGVIDGPGTNFPDSEVEPYVDVNPTNSLNIVAIWQQDRWSNGGSRGNVAGVSTDGGSNWQIVPVPQLTDCTGGPWQRASDPWLSFSPDGTLHQMSLVFDVDPPAKEPAGFGRNAMVASKSIDGGFTWSTPIVLKEDENARFLNDKNSLTADPTNPNLVYAVWDRLTISKGDAINPDVAVPLGFRGPIYFARSTDGGDSWEPARNIYSPGGNNQTIGNQIVVQPDGTVINFFSEVLNFRNDDLDGQFDVNLALLRSQDSGETWQPRGRPIRFQDANSIGAVTPDFLVPVRDASILFDVAVDPNSGALHVVWQDARFIGVDEIAYSQSIDGGFTWSAPVPVNKTPFNADVRMRQAFLPSVSVNQNGGVAVTYYDFRFDDGSGELTDYWAVQCPADCSDPGNWLTEDRLTTASFDYLLAPFANGLFLGDYMGLAASAAEFLPVFGQSSAADPASEFFRRFGP